MSSSVSTIRAAFDADQFRALGHKLVDRLAGYLGAATGGAKMPVMPGVSNEQLNAAWSSRFQRGAGRFDELVARMVAGSNHLHHPRYVGHQVPPTLPVAALAELTVALLNNSLAVSEMGPSGAAIERSLIEWMTGAVGWGAGAGGVLTSGGALGNLTALLAARQAKAGDSWNDGTAPRLAILASEQAHYSVERAVRVMGFGRHGFVPVPVDETFRLRASALEESYRAATRAGLTVIAVSASACSTATGTYDPLEEIAEFCAAQGLWLHVDAAHGASALLTKRYRGLLKGIDRADSLVWDAHKMMLMPLLVTGVLFKDRAAGAGAFASPRASYLYEDAPDAADEISRRAFECSKPALGFPLYAALSLYGVDAFGQYVAGTYDLGRRFAEMIAATDDFELAVHPDANIVCFRYTGGRGKDLDAVQARARKRIVGEGAFYLVQVRLPAGLFLRTTIINPFTSEEDLAGLLTAVREAAA
ncbi:MAG: aminotransferase class I/II-fold pyridoxal phosphate-dependent enzyme [Gemmatimonadetes bacterium]|nr:aminotransferase class I/II-fold pyridoxal phosphate-dependent enzyme [Gemmatimonadota bacterium]